MTGGRCKISDFNSGTLSWPSFIPTALGAFHTNIHCHLKCTVSKPKQSFSLDTESLYQILCFNQWNHQPTSSCLVILSTPILHSCSVTKTCHCFVNKKRRRRRSLLALPCGPHFLWHHSGLHPPGQHAKWSGCLVRPQLWIYTTHKCQFVFPKNFSVVSFLWSKIFHR